MTETSERIRAFVASRATLKGDEKGGLAAAEARGERIVGPGVPAALNAAAFITEDAARPPTPVAR